MKAIEAESFTRLSESFASRSRASTAVWYVAAVTYLVPAGEPVAGPQLHTADTEQ